MVANNLQRALALIRNSPSRNPGLARVPGLRLSPGSVALPALNTFARNGSMAQWLGCCPCQAGRIGSGVFQWN